MRTGNEELFDEKSAARVLKIAPRTLRRYRTDGKISFHRLPGGRVRYSLDQLVDFRSSCRVEASSTAGHIWPPLAA